MLVFIICSICLFSVFVVCFFFFFFQAEDGIRDTSVTGVQTCALPISFTELWNVGSPCSIDPASRSRSLRTRSASAETGAQSGRNDDRLEAHASYEIGRASCRERE